MRWVSGKNKCLYICGSAVLQEQWETLIGTSFSLKKYAIGPEGVVLTLLLGEIHLAVGSAQGKERSTRFALIPEVDTSVQCRDSPRRAHKSQGSEILVRPSFPVIKDHSNVLMVICL